MAIETRVHNLWVSDCSYFHENIHEMNFKDLTETQNHLIESASPKTASLLIWDTGVYSILPRKVASNNKPISPQTTDNDSDSDSSSDTDSGITTSIRTPIQQENEKLIDSFKTRHTRLRLHGTRLPKDYTITLRLPSNNDIPKLSKRRRSKRSKHRPVNYSTDSDSETTSLPRHRPQNDEHDNLDTDSEEDTSTRLNNAYPGSTNSIGSIHQRRWFMMLDRHSSGFVRDQNGKWERDGDRGFDPFFVRGKEVERSIVTGRLAADVEADEGMEGYRGRSGWTGIKV